ncbi:acetyl-CoA C-acetyltransferase [soil metagenome]
MPEAVIVAATRSPIGRANKGSLADCRPDDMAAQMVQAALNQIPQLDPARIDDLVLGCGMPGGLQGGNLARVVAILLGLDGLPGTTVTRYCASSLQSTRMAFHAIRAGEGHAFVSAGVESVSSFRYGHSDALHGEDQSALVNPSFAAAVERTARRSVANAPIWRDPRDEDVLPDPYIAMGQTAENVAGLKGVSRREQDEYAALSQSRAQQAITAGIFDREISPVTLPDGSTVSCDDGPRTGVTVETLSQLQPVFRPDGTVTAGNSCPLNDGAAALVITSDTLAKELGLAPLARIVSTAVSGLSPEIMGLGPVEACRRALTLAGMSINDIDLIEINEAFAAQVIPSARELCVDIDKLNVHGGAIALGHPFGMTGARITTTLLNALRTRDGQFGLETMCIGGGQGMAMIVERLN